MFVKLCLIHLFFFYLGTRETTVDQFSNYTLNFSTHDTFCQQYLDERIPSSVHYCCRWMVLCTCMVTLSPADEPHVTTCNQQMADNKYPCYEYLINNKWKNLCPSTPVDTMLLTKDDPVVKKLIDEVQKEKKKEIKKIIKAIVFACGFGGCVVLLVGFCLVRGIWYRRRKKKKKRRESQKSKRAVASLRRSVKASSKSRKVLPKFMAGGITAPRDNTGSDEDKSSSKRRRTTTPAAPDPATTSMDKNSFNSRAVQTQPGFSKLQPNQSTLSKKVNMNELKKLVI